MATTRVNKLDMANRGPSYPFDGGVCDCVILKLAHTGVGGASSVDYGGFPMTELAIIPDDFGPVFQMWGLQNAPQGINTLTMTITAGAIISSVESYSGVSRTAVFPNQSGTARHSLGSGSLTNIQVDLTTTEDDCILVGLGGYRGSGVTNMVAGSNTLAISVDPPSGGDNLSFESNPLVTGPAGTYHLQGTTGGGSVSIIISLLVAALTPGPAATVSFIPQVIIV